MVDKTENNTSFVVSETLKCNSLEYGKPAFRHKIYYSTPQELKKHIDDLKALGLFEEQN